MPDTSSRGRGPSARPAPLSWWLRRTDQAVLAVVTLVSLAAMVGHWWVHGGRRGRLIEIDDAPPLTAHFQVDINSAGWPELAQLPDVGETLARRIVESREAAGPFADHEDLRRVQGIGPKTLDGMRPYLRPMPAGAATAGP